MEENNNIILCLNKNYNLCKIYKKKFNRPDILKLVENDDLYSCLKHINSLSLYEEIYILSILLEHAILNNASDIVKHISNLTINYIKLERIIMERLNCEFYIKYDLIKSYHFILFRCFNIAILYDNKEVADFLHDKININTLNYNHESRLHEIVKNNLNVNLIDIYIYYKIDINLKNKNYLTPIELAIMLKRYEHIERLLFYNCKVDHDILKLAHEYDIPFPLIHNIRTMISF